MLDYSGLAALKAVIETQGFESAAEKLCITQSAVSQRLKTLENHYGQPLLIRTMPYVPTPLGQLLLAHFKRIEFLEDSLKSVLAGHAEEEPPFLKISIALSRDSLDTWFQQVIRKLKKIHPIRLDIQADDQELTLDYLKKGLVSACASTQEKSITGCQSDFLGYLDYILVASPEYIHQYFNPLKFSKEKDLKKALYHAPYIIFDHNDNLHARYLKKFFSLETNLENTHTVPSVAGFREYALNGYAYALIPRIDVELALKHKKLIQLFPDKVWEMPVYWHSWVLENQYYKEFNQLVIKISRETLRYS